MRSPAKLKLIFNRVVSVSLGILLQLIVILSGVVWLQEYIGWINGFLTVLSWVTVIVIMSSRTNPSYKIAWIVLILAFPVAGITIYLLLGGNKASSRENRKMQQITAGTAMYLPQDEEVLRELSLSGSAAHNHARYLLNAAHYPVYNDSSAVYYPTGETAFAAMLAALETAEHYIFLEYFIIDKGKMWGAVLDILRRKAAQGVDVRVL